MSQRYRVLLTDRAWPDADIERRILGEVDAELIDAPAHDEATLLRLAADVDAIATCWARVTSAVIEAARRCRVICRLGIGLDNIDVQTATRLKIPVTNVPDYCLGEVADHAFALLLAGARKVAFFHRRTKGGEYQLKSGAPLRRLVGQTLGLLGLGPIARNLAPKARAFGLSVVACTPSSQDYGTGCRMVAFSELLEQSDYISLHAPLNAGTRHLFGADAFARMKPSAWLINTSRGGLIDHAALWQALQQNQIAGAALDVFDPEPPDLSQPLFRDERVIVTPHAAFASEESIVELRTRVARQIARMLRGERPEYIVNPSVFDTMLQ